MRNDYKNLTIQNLPVRSIVLVRHKIKRPGYRIARQHHPGHELIYVDYGKLRLSVQNSDFVLETGDCLIIPPSVHHHFEGEQGRPFDFLNIVYRGRTPDALAGQTLHLLPDERRIMHILKEESETRSLHSSQIMTLKLNELLLLLERRAAQRATPQQPVRGDNRIRYQDVMTQKALNYLTEHLAKPLDACAVARHVGVSDSHLRLLLRKETGQSLRQHLRRLRIDFAKHLLRESPENVDAIAYSVGYRSFPHFCTIFKQLVKMTPSEYAKSLL